MEKKLPIIEYVNKHLEHITIEQLMSYYEYSAANIENYFLMYFGKPFSLYVIVQQKNRQVLKSVREFVVSHFDEIDAIDLNTIGKDFGYSYDHIDMIYHEVFGISAADYIDRLIRFERKKQKRLARI